MGLKFGFLGSYRSFGNDWSQTIGNQSRVRDAATPTTRLRLCKAGNSVNAQQDKFDLAVRAAADS
jgi:hypothetical protein